MSVEYQPMRSLIYVDVVKEDYRHKLKHWLYRYHILDKKPCYCLPKTAKIPEIVAKGLAIHNVLEYTNLASFLPQIYEEQEGAIP